VRRRRLRRTSGGSEALRAGRLDLPDVLLAWGARRIPRLKRVSLNRVSLSGARAAAHVLAVSFTSQPHSVSALHGRISSRGCSSVQLFLSPTATIYVAGARAITLGATTLTARNCVVRQLT